MPIDDCVAFFYHNGDFLQKFLRFSLKRLTSFGSPFDRGYNSFNFIELCSDFVSGLLFALRLISGHCVPSFQHVHDISAGGAPSHARKGDRAG